VKGQFLSWQIQAFCNSCNNKFPSPERESIVELVKCVYDKISEEKIKKTFCLIGFVMPNNNDEVVIEENDNDNDMERNE
jgi:hypothetical protein